ncbi:DUF3135 domain-containing protein [Geotalea sp. SG265]|uniref:DUF3135 domain-containing protein n=1 Tax=Geotalea sp. SG265 TaxID=2922867 RepID=UPI001FAF512C|nr:DUF3135 domain-containing protein [Geotalea sp. SG265]
MNSELKKEFGSYTPTELSELYGRDPDLFDDLAADAISKACIGRTPEETVKLRQMQWTIDGQLRKARTPLERMHIMENIFYDRVYGEDGLLAKLATGWTQVLRAGNLYRKSGLHLLKR